MSRSNKSLLVSCVRDASCASGGGIAKVVVPLQAQLAQMETVFEPWVISQVGSQQLSSHEVDFDHAAQISYRDFPLRLFHIHGLWTPFELQCARLARRHGAKLVFSPHGMLEPWAFRHKAVKKWLAWHLYQRKLLGQADLLVVNSHQEYLGVRARGLGNPVAVIPNAVDPAGLEPRLPRQVNERRRVLFLSRIAPIKGLDDLLEAWSRLPGGHSFELCIAGAPDPGSDYLQKMQDKTASLGLGESVRFVGPLHGPEKWAAYEQADLFVLPSRGENFGIVVAEAMLAGLPVITTTATPWAVLREQGMGWMVDNSVQSLAEALGEALTLAPQKLLAMGALARAYAQRYSWQEVAALYQSTYQWLLQQAVPKPDWIYLE